MLLKNKQLVKCYGVGAGVFEAVLKVKLFDALASYNTLSKTSAVIVLPLEDAGVYLKLTVWVFVMSKADPGGVDPSMVKLTFFRSYLPLVIVALIV